MSFLKYAASALVGSKKQSLTSLIEGHTVTTSNPFEDTHLYEIGWNQFEADYEPELQARVYNHFSMEVLAIMKRKIEQRDEATDPNTTEHDYIHLKNRRVLQIWWLQGENGFKRCERIR